MALRYIDGFDTYPTTDVSIKWGSASLTSSSMVSGRFGGNCLRVSSSSTSTLTKTIDAQSTWTVGYAFKTSQIGVLTPVALLDAGSVQCDLRVNSDGTLKVTRNGTTLGTTTNAITTGVWTYVEVKILIHASAGTVDVHVNGASWLALTGQNTKATSNATANQVQLNLFSVSGSGTYDLDDVYICDGTGSANNTFLGDVRVESLKPAGAGNYTQFTHNGASQNYNCVNESSEDGDTTYNSDSTVGHIDTFTFGAMSSTPAAVMGIQTNLVARKDDAGSHTASALFRSGGTDYAQTAASVASTYAYLLTVNETDPSTSSAWTASAINAIEAGYKLVS